jgi:hypothetical protein
VTVLWLTTSSSPTKLVRSWTRLWPCRNVDLLCLLTITILRLLIPSPEKYSPDVQLLFSRTRRRPPPHPRLYHYHYRPCQYPSYNIHYEQTTGTPKSINQASSNAKSKISLPTYDCFILFWMYIYSTYLSGSYRRVFMIPI